LQLDQRNRDRSMDSTRIFWSTIRTSLLYVAAGSQSAARVLSTRSEESFTIAVSLGAAIVTSSRTAPPRLISNRARSHLSVEVQCLPDDNKTIAVPSVSQEKAEANDTDALASVALPEAPAQPAPRNERVQLIIDSLQNYDLIKPISVVVDSLADKIFTAEAPDLNLSISENSLGGALLLLKDRIATIYEEYRMKKTLDPEQARRFEILQTYIGKTKRSWL
jgi:hypothetical protein